ncbi:MAG: hypothetical protein NTX19_04855 [Gemmatimonadetes bacterium]|nr:hypothetical protein [Gemmatimonadota bacterium]
MKSRLVLIGALVAASSSVAEAQCSSGVAQQGCQTALDLVTYMTPQLATAIAAGSPTLAQSGALGGLGRFALTIRGTGVLNGAFPKIGDKPFLTNTSAQTYTSKDAVVPGAGVDFSVGLWKGVNLGATHVGGIDAIVSALYLPDVTGDGNDFSIKAKDGNLKLGYGIRVGVLDESVVTPGLYLSYLQRDLPTVSLTGASSSASGAGTAEGKFSLNDYSVKTTAIRLVAQKSLLIFGLTAGVGQDTYKSSASVSASVTSPTAGTSTGAASLNMTRTNVFAGISFNLFVFKLAVEAGQVSGGSIANTVNNFGKPAGDSRTYASGGIRFAF